MKGMKIMFIVMALSMVLAFAWDSVPAIGSSVHAVLDPSFGKLMDYNLNLGFVLIMLLFAVITTLTQKYLSDQDTLKTLKEEQKLIQQEMKLYRQDPKKTTELTSKSFELTMKTMPITMKPAIYTLVPFILFFRWFNDYFVTNKVQVFGMSWFWAYIISILVFSLILKKVMKVE